MGDSDINQLKDAEFKEAFDEFDTVILDWHPHFTILVMWMMSEQGVVCMDVTQIVYQDENSSISNMELLEVMMALVCMNVPLHNCFFKYFF